MKRILLAGLVVFGLIQLVPVERDNPPVVAEVQAPAEVQAILRRACYDCHSHQTRWPWYSHVAPISWMTVHNTHEGREHMNFSNWPRYAEDQDEIGEEVGEGKMPPPLYAMMAADRQLSDAERKLLSDWAHAGAAEAGTGAAGKDDDGRHDEDDDADHDER